MHEPDFETSTIPVEYIEKIIEERKKINNLDLSKVTWTENGKPIEIPKNILDDWRFTGLNNIDFIDTGFYLKGFDAEPTDVIS